MSDSKQKKNESKQVNHHSRHRHHHKQGYHRHNHSSLPPRLEHQHHGHHLESESQRLDVNQLVGHCLFKQEPGKSVQTPPGVSADPSSSLQLQARLLTGTPLIKSPSGGRYFALVHPQHWQALVYCQQQQLLSQQLAASAAQQHKDVTLLDKSAQPPANDPRFRPRVLRPRRRRKGTRQGQSSSRSKPSTDASGGDLEFDYADEAHFLPTNLLSDDGRASDDSDTSHQKESSPQAKPVLRHSDSLEPSAMTSNDHVQLRKTFSWANERAESSMAGGQFSLFPQTWGCAVLLCVGL